MPPLRKTYLKDQIHNRWEAVYRGNPLVDQLNERILTRIIECVKPHPCALFLDAGCGVGDHSIRIARRGYRCVGVDLSERILEAARLRVSQMGSAAKVSLACQAVEDLAFDDSTFDVVHCRGVLMHIPSWEIALKELFRVLKPGGWIVILELNHQSLESWIVRFVRLFRLGQSRLIRKSAGLEFWSEEDGEPLLARVANIARLEEQLRGLGAEVHVREASEFWDINRFPAGLLRRAATRFNTLWFSLRLPSRLSSGNLIVAKKAARSA